MLLLVLEKANVADTICDLEVNEPIAATPIDPPTMSITITVNTSPLAGTEGKKLTSTQIRDRLIQKHKTMLELHSQKMMEMTLL